MHSPRTGVHPGRERRRNKPHQFPRSCPKGLDRGRRQPRSSPVEPEGHPTSQVGAPFCAAWLNAKETSSLILLMHLTTHYHNHFYTFTMPIYVNKCSKAGKTVYSCVLSRHLTVFMLSAFEFPARSYTNLAIRFVNKSRNLDLAVTAPSPSKQLIAVIGLILCLSDTNMIINLVKTKSIYCTKRWHNQFGLSARSLGCDQRNSSSKQSKLSGITNTSSELSYPILRNRQKGLVNHVNYNNHIEKYQNY